MKKRYMALAVGAAGIGFAASYTFAALRCTRRTALDVPIDPSPDGDEPSGERLIRHFDQPAVGYCTLQPVNDLVEHPLDQPIEYYRLWKFDFSAKTVIRIAACDVVGRKVGIVRTAQKGTYRFYISRMKINVERALMTYRQHLLAPPSKVTYAVYGACPSDDGTVGLIEIYRSAGHPLDDWQEHYEPLSPFELQQRYLRKAAVERHAPGGQQLRYAVSELEPLTM